MNTKKIVGSFIWKFLERGSAQIISLIVQIILARIIAPEDFGVLAILMVFINVSNVFIQKGFSSALIRKKEVTDDDFNTAFVVSELFALVIITALFLASDFIEKYYDIASLSSCLRVISFSLFFGAFYSVQNAELIRKMKFRQIFIRSVISSAASGVIGVLLALLGYGVWALVLQTLLQQILICLTTMIVCDWKPRLRFSRQSFAELFSFGSRILVAEFISIGVENVRTLFIGKQFSASDLAYYDRGQLYPATGMRSVYDAISSVLLPVFSKEQNDRGSLAHSIEQTISITHYFVFPVFVGLAAVAKPFVLILLTSKWISCIPFFVLFCIYQLAFPMYGIIKQSLYALGKSGDVLILEIIRSILFLIALLAGIMFSPFVVAVTSLIAMYISTLIYIIYTHKYIKYNLNDIFLNTAKISVQCTIMYIFIMYINRFFIPNILLLGLDIAIGVVVYVFLSIVMRNNTFSYCLYLVKSKKKERDKK